MDLCFKSQIAGVIARSGGWNARLLHQIKCPLGREVANWKIKTGIGLGINFSFAEDHAVIGFKVIVIGCEEIEWIMPVLSPG